jgi:filamentous hemagglutinin
MVEWIKFINALGKVETSKEFFELNFSIGELAKISEDLTEYNDPVGHTKHYKYVHSGLEIGIRGNVLNHIHFYFDGTDGYSVYEGKLLYEISSGWTENAVIQTLGKPVASGGGKMDMIIGYINHWIKYEMDIYALHLQFDQCEQLCRVTLMLSE